MPKKPSEKPKKTDKAEKAEKAPKAVKAAKPAKAAKAVKTPAAGAKSTRKGPSLLVVESPAKERTISRFLKDAFIVKSSFGHVRDLPVRKIGVNVDDGFAPQYVVLPRA